MTNPATPWMTTAEAEPESLRHEAAIRAFLRGEHIPADGEVKRG